MNDRLVLSSGYFNLAGGRRQDSADSFRVNASLKTHAGDVVGFYAVTEASTPGPLGERARRLAVDAIQGEYASRFDLQPGARLKAAVQSAHHTLLTEFGGQVSVGLTVLVGHGPSLYLLQVPPSQAFVVHDGSLHSVSAGGSGDGADAFANALGSSSGPRVSLFRDTVEPLDTVVLCSSWFARELEPEELRVAFAPGDADSVTANLFRHARELDARDASCVALHAATEDAPPRYADDGEDEDDRAPSTGLWSQVDEAVGSISYVWQRAVDELRAPGSPARTRRAVASTAAIPTSSASLNQSSVQTPVADYYEDTYDQEPVLDDIERAPHRPGSDDATYGESGTEELPIAAHLFPKSNQTGTGDPARATIDTPPRPRSADLDEVNNFIQSTLEMSQASPSVQGFSDTTVAPERIYPASRGEGVRRRRSLVDIFRPRREKVAGVAAPVLKPRLAGLDMQPRARRARPGVPVAIWLWSGVGVALSAIIIVAVFAFGGSPGINYPSKARIRAANAVADSGNLSAAAHQLSLAWIDVNQSRLHKFPPQEIRATIRYVQAQSDHVNGIIRPQATVAARLPTHNANPTQLAMGDPNLYVLDQGREQISAVDPTKPGSPQPVVGKTGDTYLQLRWGDPLAITSDGNEMVAIDRLFNVLAVAPGQVPLQTESLIAPSTSTHIVAATSYATNLYLLDTNAGQLWRYLGSNGMLFVTSAGGYITTPQPKLLKHAVGVAITNDKVFIALNNGSLVEYHSGQRVASFALHLPIRLQHATQIYGRQDLPDLYLVNSSGGKIVELTQSGSYIRTLVVPSGLIPGMRQIVVSPNHQTIYFISGTTLYSIPAS